MLVTAALILLFTHYHGNAGISYDVIVYAVEQPGHQGEVEITRFHGRPRNIGNEGGIPFNRHAPEIGMGMGHETFLVDSHTVDLPMISACMYTQ